MNIIVDTNQELTIEIVIELNYEQMTTAILDYFSPHYKSCDEITSWYEGFAFHKDNSSIFYFNHYDIGDNRHCFEIKGADANQRAYFKNLMENFEQYLFDNKLD